MKASLTLSGLCPDPRPTPLEILSTAALQITGARQEHRQNLLSSMFCAFWASLRLVRRLTIRLALSFHSLAILLYTPEIKGQSSLS
jgi:hypothetical protein